MKSLPEYAPLLPTPEKDFRPAKHMREKYYTSSYVYIENPPIPMKDHRDPEDKSVVLGLKNFVTNPMKEGKIGKCTSFGGIPLYMEDDFDIKKKNATK